MVNTMPKLTYAIKQLGVHDLEDFQRLREVFGDAFDEPAAYTTDIPSSEYLRTVLAKSNHIALVAKSGDEVIGGLVAYELEKCEQERSEIYLYDLAVRETHRRKGVATHLIEELKVIARMRKAYVIFVQADTRDATAIKLYESLGNRENVYHFDIRV